MYHFGIQIIYDSSFLLSMHAHAGRLRAPGTPHPVLRKKKEISHRHDFPQRQ